MRNVFVLLFVIVAAASALPRDAWRSGFFAPPFGIDYAESSEEGTDYPEYGSLSTMFKSMQQAMTNMRRQLEDAMRRIPAIPRFPTHPVIKPIEPSDIGFDDTKPANSTSITKIVNGHKVTVNETTYVSGAEGSNTRSVFRIKTVDVQPHKDDDSSDEQETSVEQEHSVEQDHVPAIGETKPETSQETVTVDSKEEQTTSAEELENEIPKNNDEDEMMAESSEISEQLPYEWSFQQWPFFKQQHRRRFDVEVLPGVRPIGLSGDLRGDTKVNDILSQKIDAGAYIMPDPDSEFVEIKDGKLVPSIQTA